MKKKILSILLCSVIAATGAVTVNAAGKAEKHNGFEIIDETITVPDNVVMVSSYEFDDNNTYTAKILNENRDEFELLYKDCVESPQFIELPSGEKYQVAGYSSECSYDFSNTGGTYRKVKIKISEFSELSDYFNEDGTKTHQIPSGEEFIFNHKDYSCEEYVMHSNLSCLSGGILTKVYPDENGEIEIYVNTKVGSMVELLVNGSISVTGGDGTYGYFASPRLSKLTFGNVNGDYYLSVSDVTELQLYLAGCKELDSLGMFHADTNYDGIYDVKDVTHLQIGISKLKG